MEQFLGNTNQEARERKTSKSDQRHLKTKEKE